MQHILGLNLSIKKIGLKKINSNRKFQEKNKQLCMQSSFQNMNSININHLKTYIWNKKKQTKKLNNKSLWLVIAFQLKTIMFFRNQKKSTKVSNTFIQNSKNKNNFKNKKCLILEINSLLITILSDIQVEFRFIRL